MWPFLQDVSALNWTESVCRVCESKRKRIIIQPHHPIILLIFAISIERLYLLILERIHAYLHAVPTLQNPLLAVNGLVQLQIGRVCTDKYRLLRSSLATLYLL